MVQKKQGIRLAVSKKKNPSPQYAVCINNEGYKASLEVGKSYRVVDDVDEHGMIRVVDNGGEDYLFEATCFFQVPENREEELLRLASERVKLPAGPVWFEYEADVDSLVIKLKQQARSTHSTDDMDAGIIYDYEGDELVAIEVLDLYGIFV